MPISAGLREDIAVYRGFIGQQYLHIKITVTKLADRYLVYKYVPSSIQEAFLNNYRFYFFCDQIGSYVIILYLFNYSIFRMTISIS